jgi:hypothetical protein
VRPYFLLITKASLLAIKLLNMASNSPLSVPQYGIPAPVARSSSYLGFGLSAERLASRPQQIWEDEVLTAQTPRCPAATERAPDRYPVSLRLHYKATSKLGPVQGIGRTRVMSSQDIVFAPGDGLRPGMKAEIVVAWPPVLDDRHLQLVLQVTITSSQDGVLEAHILAYDFRTCRAGGS